MADNLVKVTPQLPYQVMLVIKDKVFFREQAFDREPSGV